VNKFNKVYQSAKCSISCQIEAVNLYNDAKRRFKSQNKIDRDKEDVTMKINNLSNHGEVQPPQSVTQVVESM
jgi:hypothetical protein